VCEWAPNAMTSEQMWDEVRSVLDLCLDRLGLDPFAYLVVTILGIIVWVWTSVIGDYALAGPALWVRRLSLVFAGFAAVLFTYGASYLR
jgi:hypothetical protein